tara:strand:+ start:369 stop:923 length:555 start_codon:yes stop_codon:yes gene_type:complete
MKALDALHTRISAPRLGEPAPTPEQLKNIYKAAFRAADHGLLRPWRFLVIREESREKLGRLFLQAALLDDPAMSEDKQQKLANNPLRAPLLLISIGSYQAHPKVPQVEQDLSAGAATQNMLLAAFAQGIGAMWRTGSMAYNDTVRQGLGLAEQEKIIGFLYLGTAIGPGKSLADPDSADYFKEW